MNKPYIPFSTMKLLILQIREEFGLDFYGKTPRIKLRKSIQAFHKVQGRIELTRKNSIQELPEFISSSDNHGERDIAVNYLTEDQLLDLQIKFRKDIEFIRFKTGIRPISIFPEEKKTVNIKTKKRKELDHGQTRFQFELQA